MKRLWISIHLITSTFVICDINVYYANRNGILAKESLQCVGGNITLNQNESLVNNCLMKRKFKELDYAFDNPEYFNFSRHYFLFKDEIRNSKVFKIIKDMPKGAALHIHDMALSGPDELLKITYEEHLYVCFGDSLKLKFADSVPKQPCSRWQLMKHARAASRNVTEFDMDLRKRFTLVVKNPDTVYPTIKETWTNFINYFTTVDQMLTYRPVWEQYFYDALIRLKKDNIMYLELRSLLPNLYELDGTVYDQIITARAYKKVVDRFVKTNSDFFGMKLIYAPSRHVNRDQLTSYLELARQIKKEMPSLFAGFDLVGEEDLGSPLINFVPQLTLAAKDMNFFFHAGETDWYGTSTDVNLLDAVLLGAKRLGHAYALTKHPEVMRLVVQADIGLEVNVISNAVLSLVRDVRNHPLSTFLARGLPVVLSSDDPGAWEADPLSDDFYVAFVGVASRLSDIRLLKQLALNSLTYSALDPIEKREAILRYERSWNKFIAEFDCAKY